MPALPTGDPAVAHRTRSRLPGVPGVWIFVMVDMTLFGVLFLAFTLERAGSPDDFGAAQATLDVGLGLTNTIILLTSSWFVALAVAAVREDGDRRTGEILMTAAVACGAAFVVSKIVEYSGKAGADLSSGFFLLYFVITGLHLLHLVGGMVVLALLARALRSGRFGLGRATGLESGATYWHMVDLLWVMIFPLLYLVRWT